jgi:1-acyl-sn-glycerol-3-phosphate acyltransferase
VADKGGKVAPGEGAGPAQDNARKVCAPLARRLWHLDVQGLDRLPAEGPAILCPNHISFLDSVFLMLVVPRRISFVGKAEYMDSWKTKHLFPMLGMIPIDRGGGKKSMVALERAEQVLERGELFGIFPEGTRSRDGYLYKGHTGAARLALKMGCPIYPVGIVGTDRIQPPHAKLPKLFKQASITFGKPIRPEKFKKRDEDRFVLRQVIDEVMYEIREMTGQVYKNVYATRKAEDVEVPPAHVLTQAEASRREPELAHA